MSRKFLSILYRDDEIIVVDKPSGLLSVPGVLAERWDSMATRVQSVLPTARVVHRLDCATSGVMVMALTAQSHREMNRQFREREVGKCYLALAYGQIKQDTGTVNLPLIKDWPNRPKQKVCFEQGKEAITHWQVLARQQDYTYVELTPITGRSHQLRMHMKEIGHPLLGDDFYAPEPALTMAKRLQLHAHRLHFKHPVTGIAMEFVAPTSLEFKLAPSASSGYLQNTK
ncbi:RluA family pseudouridine synthase [Piscirickettsia litoralis]|uniref:Pseudouridine synthase n=1 Tax=Piscirickettsia litoralis TaxID=1891921 RepID=A0ABX2ZZV8_9GAMM|nr:RluA family pseudouridine synthase [Piscirickettsia litoralis]ODN41760.1 RNA pseudouridine synthase [Piscirickettsia litoralis]